jgi:hypothetical protein
MWSWKFVSLDLIWLRPAVHLELESPLKKKKKKKIVTYFQSIEIIIKYAQRPVSCYSIMIITLLVKEKYKPKDVIMFVTLVWLLIDNQLTFKQAWGQ